jgi:hypothetical protein
MSGSSVVAGERVVVAVAVEHGHLVAAREQFLDCRSSDKMRPADDECVAHVGAAG